MLLYPHYIEVTPAYTTRAVFDSEECHPCLLYHCGYLLRFFNNFCAYNWHRVYHQSLLNSVYCMLETFQHNLLVPSRLLLQTSFSSPVHLQPRH